MENAMMAVTRPQETADDAFLRECVMMGEIRRRRAENEKLRAEIAAHEARHKREMAAKFARYEREIAAEKQRDLRWITAVRMAALFLAGAGCAAILVAIAVMVMAGV